MRRGNRRTAMRVRDGRVRRKNNWSADAGDYIVREQRDIRLDRRAPGRGRRHVVTIAQLRSFIAVLPGWDDIAIGLDAIVLDGATDCMGWHSPGVAAICAWEQGSWWSDADEDFVRDHREVLDLLDVDRVRTGGRLEVRWSEAQARAFQLLHILPHELGHHHDRMTTRTRRDAARGEPDAEEYALLVLDAVWPTYARRFGV